jgi:RNA polymerase sigma factor (sigma-70 family)
MDERDLLAERFEEHRPRLRAVAYRMLGSPGEAEDAIQEAWLRLGRSGADGIENLGGWLTTVVARICLDALRSRRSRREEPMGEPRVGVRVPDPIVGREDRTDPEHEALLADSVGPALLAVLDTLTPAERLAFVLHDVFGVPFREIAPIVGRTHAAARQLASRARRRVRGGAAPPDADPTRQREVVDAFLTASREGDFGALLAVLEARGARAVAEQTLTFSRLSPFVRPALVNGAAGVVVTPRGRPFAIMGFTVRRGKIVEIDVLADPERLSRLDLAILDD